MPLIRKLEHDDFKNLLIIETESFASGYSPYFIKMMPILFGNTSYISLKGHSPQGYVATALEQGSCRAWILSLAVRPKYRQLGLGKALLATGLQALAAAGAGEVLLSVSPDNQLAITLYEKMGFSICREVSDYFGPGEERIIMKKILPEEEN
ncbi:MAG: N-acetyltransferase [Eubacteriales bacterium]|nr:N-acetyltransferase [Eubacteriales bacterium]